jgi:uncharacterized membrane protein
VAVLAIGMAGWFILQTKRTVIIYLRILIIYVLILREIELKVRGNRKTYYKAGHVTEQYARVRRSGRK